MSRSKENKPLTNLPRLTTTRTALGRLEQNDDFFTDSILDNDLTQSSRIPSPSPQKALQAKQRRARHVKSTSANLNGRNRSSLVNGGIPHLREQNPNGASSIQRTSSSPTQPNILATPPFSRNGPLVTSPQWHISSPPPHELPDVYQQIADEEDLAATERDYSESEGYPEQETRDPGSITQEKRRPEFLAGSTNSSRASMFGHNRIRRRQDKFDDDRLETASDPTGMSFVDGLTDRDLAAAMTPHFAEAARDHARLHEVWQNQKPVAFNKVKAPRFPEVSPNNTENGLSTKPRAFTKANITRTNGRAFEEVHSEPIDRPVSESSFPDSENHRPHHAIWHDEDGPLKSLPINSRVERSFPFSRPHPHGFPGQRPVLTEQNLEQQNKGIRDSMSQNALSASIHRMQNGDNSGPANSLKQRPDPTPHQALHTQHDHRSSLNGGTITNKDSDHGEDLQDVDWAVAAMDIPLPSTESESLVQETSPESKAVRIPFSPEKSRRWDLDFTGQSFQVSESPPVRDRPLREPIVGKEIENLSRRAVTTSRLDEIRKRHSQEQLKSISGSPLRPSDSPGAVAENSASKANGTTRCTSADRTDVNTPVSRRHVSADAADTDERSSQETDAFQRTPHDLLQRFARVMSNTPKSSPPSVKGPAIVENDVAKGPSATPQDLVDQTQPPVIEQVVRAVTETPRVIGAWTDTILPDTIKTVRAVKPEHKQLETPHVSAGGWIDTPAPVGARKISRGMTPIVEEMTEDLKTTEVDAPVPNGIEEVKAEADVKIEDIDPANSVRIGLEGILDRAKQKLASQDVDVSPRDNDTLNLGNDTIESLQDLLTLDATDMTILSQIGILEEAGVVDRADSKVEADEEMLDKLGVRLKHICDSIQDARKGISRIEKLSSLGAIPTEGAPSTQPAIQIQADSNNTNKLLGIPTATFTATLPIPFLFYPPTKRNRKVASRLPKPTPLGWLTLALWTWYVTECIMSAIFSRPETAAYYTWPAEPEPEFPFVIPTMLYRWTRLRDILPPTHLPSVFLMILRPIWRITRAIWRVASMVLGLSDGFVDSTVPPSSALTQENGDVVISATKKVLSTVAAAAAGAMNGHGGGAGMDVRDMDMMNDEYL